MKVFVTGGHGFLGRVIVRQLHAQGHAVATFSRGNYPSQETRHYQGDLLDYDALKRAMAGHEAVFHVAAKVGMWGKYDDFYQINVFGTENILRACRELGIRYLVFTSSPSVVFDGKNSEGKNESLPYPQKFNAFYPQTKALAEKRVMGANGASLKTVCLRPHLIWGPEDPYLFPGLVEKARAGKLRILGNGTAQIDCIYVDNAASAHLQAFAQLQKDPASVEGKTYFISQGAPIPIADFINRLLAAGGRPPVTRRLPAGLVCFVARTTETMYRLLGISAEPPITHFLAQQLSTAHWYDISAARKDFGYEAKISLNEGMERLQAWALRTSEHECRHL